MIECDEIISFMDIVSTKMTNTIATNVTKIVIVKKVRAVLLPIILLLIITIRYNYGKQKGINALKM